MARTILPLAGAFVGSFFGAPQLGFAIGSVIGNAVDPQRIKGPRIGDANVQTSQEGTPRPIVYGTAAVMGNLIDRGPLNKVITEERQGKGGGPVVENESLFMTFAIRICEGPIGGVLRIWEDERLVYDVRQESEIVQDSARYAQEFTLYLGDEDQLPDPDLESIHGAGNTPAHRGSAYIVFKEKNLTERRGSIPQFRFEVSNTTAELVPADFVIAKTGSAKFWPTPDFSSYSGPFTRSPTTIPISFTSVDYVGGLAIFNVNATRIERAALGSLTSNVVSDVIGVAGDGARIRRFTERIAATSRWTTIDGGQSIVGFEKAESGTSGAPIDIARLNSGRWVLLLAPRGGASEVMYSDKPQPTVTSDWTTLSVLPPAVDNARAVLTDGSKLVVLGFSGGGAPTQGSAVSTDGGATWAEHSVPGVSSSRTPRIGGGVYYNGTYIADTQSNTLEAQILRSLDGESWTATLGHTEPVFGVGGQFHSTTVGAGLLVATADQSVYVSADEGQTWTTYSAPVDGDPGEYHAFYAGAVFVESTPGGPSDLGVIVSDVSQRCDINPQEFNVDQLTGTEVTGLVIAGLYNGGDAVDALRKVYFFDPVEQDGQVVFVNRGAASVATITESDLVDAPESAKRGQALEFPRKLHLDYQNAEIGYAPAKATAARSSSDVRVVGEVSIEAPVVLTSDEAAQTADKLLKTTWTEAEGEIQFSVGEEFLYLTPTDIVTLVVRGVSRRLRITKIERQSGVLSITAMIDRVSAYTSSATGPVLRPPTQPPEAFAGPSTLAVMDIPALIDTNDQLGIYLAANGASTAWAGARVQVSTDGGATFTDLVDIRRFCRIGTLLDDVTAALVGPVDSTNELRVDFGALSPDLPSFTEEQWLSERGAIAVLRSDGSAEIMQYRDAVPAGGSSSSSSSDAGIWTLSPLIRGRLNSGATAHTSGATVVYLEDAAFVELSATLIGRDLTFRAVSFGEVPEGSSFEQTITYAGRSQIELPVVDLEVSEDSMGVITATWTRRDRFGSDVAPILSANWQGYRVTFTGDSVATFDTLNPSYTYDASGLGASAVTVSVSQLNRITGAGPAVSEIV